MAQLRIRIFSSFCDSVEAKRVVDQISYYQNSHSSTTVSITDGDDYTHVIIWNTAMPQIREGVPIENVIGFAYEPWVYLGLTSQFVEYAKQNIYKYYIGDLLNLPAPFVEGICYLTYNARLPVLKPNTNIMSLMISQKMHQPGHKYRHILANAILKTDLPIDIYGRGCRFYNNDSRIKNEFEKYEMYDGYEFHICIENIQSNHYFSEKIINSLLTNTTPVYLGCRNIETYFPDNVVCLTGEPDQDIQVLTDICRNPDKYKKDIDIDAIDKKVSLKNNITQLFIPAKI